MCTLNLKNNLFLISLMFFSCSNNLYEKGLTKYEYNYEFEKYEPYLSIDSVYKTKEEKLKFEQLKDKFIEVIFDSIKTKLVLDTSICYCQKGGRSQGDYIIRKYSVENILHSENFDTLVVLFIMDWAFYDENNEVIKYDKMEMSQITSTPIKIIIDKNGSWNFVCKPIIYGNDGSPYSEEMLKKVRLSMKRSIIRCSYFKKDLTPDPTFFYRMFTNPNIFIPDPINNGFPLN